MVLDVSNTSHDLIVVNGLLTLTGGTIQINSAGLANGTYKIMQYASASGKAANLALAYAQAGKIAQLVDSGSGEIDLQIASASRLTEPGTGPWQRIATSANPSTLPAAANRTTHLPVT